MNPTSLITARERLLSVALEGFASDPDVVGIFLGGSLAAGGADAYSDIDLRVVVTPKKHADFVSRRCEIPEQWPGFLFNEWMPGAQHCVSHFRPFCKIDIFYLSEEGLKPSPWYGLPHTILHDPTGVITTLLARSKRLSFATSIEEVDLSISKGLAAAHEAYRRTHRRELLYAQTLLDELRHQVMKADDWLFGRTPLTATYAKFEQRGSREVLDTLAASYCAHDPAELKAALRLLACLYRRQVTALHEMFSLGRPLQNDMTALDIIS